MDIFSKTLSNGLTLQAVPLPGTNVVTSLILVKAGSRCEDRSISGLSHFLEHMFFKGAKKYKTPKEVAQAVDSYGGEFNAFTGKESVGYYVKSGKDYVNKGLDVLSDMMLFSTFPKEEIEKERGVILEEMAMYLDTPSCQISWDFERLLFGDQPIGRDQIGNSSFIKKVEQKDFFAYRDALYVPSNVVIALSGAVDEKILDQLEESFPFQNNKAKREPYPFDASLVKERIFIRKKETEQYHLTLGSLGLPKRHPLYPVLVVLTTILGGNMSSRMFQHVREEKGLCYSIATYLDSFTDTGLIATYAGVKKSDVLKAIEAMLYEYNLLRDVLVKEDELVRAKQYIIGKSDLITEDTEVMAQFYAENKLLYNVEESLEVRNARILKVSSEDVKQLAQQLFNSKKFRLAVIGPDLDQENLLRLLDG